MVLEVRYEDDVALLLELFFFFFQAEDGIRDLTVTGVQTCALPISTRSCGCSITSNATFSRCSRTRCSACLTRRRPTLRSAKGMPVAPPKWNAVRGSRSSCPRSEERRVGKEGRSGGWRHHVIDIDEV